MDPNRSQGTGGYNTTSTNTKDHKNNGMILDALLPRIETRGQGHKSTTKGSDRGKSGQGRP